MHRRFSFRLFRRTVCRWLLLPALSGAVRGQEVPPEMMPLFSLRSWNRADGLTSNEITGLSLDRAGYLWIATPTGLARFDGSRFLNYDFDPGRQLAASGVAAIVADPADDGLWVAPRAGGLVRFRQGRFEEHALPGHYSQRRIARLFTAADAALWIGFEGGEVMRLKDGRHELFGTKDGLGPRRASHIAADGSGRVWVSNGSRLAWYEAGALHPLPLEGINEDVRIASARQDGPWVLTRGNLHKVVAGQLAIKIKVSGNFNATSVQALLEDSHGFIWTGTRARGVRRLTLPEWKSDLAIVTPEDIGVLLEDPMGNIWAGSNGGGLVRVRAGVVRRFDKSQGLLESHTLSVCQDNAGTIWVANRDGGVAFINAQGRMRTLTAPNVRETFSARSVAPIGPAGVWVTTSHGLLRAEQAGLLAIDAPGSPPQPPEHGQMRVMHLARNGDLWIALGPSQLGRLRDGTWRDFTAAEGLGVGVLHAIAEDAQGRIWAGNEEGKLYSCDGERFSPVSLLVPTGAGAIQAIHFDAAGTCWIGTAGAGLLRLGAPIGHGLDTRHGLPTNNINQMISDNQGSLWFGSPQGIFHVRCEELEKFFSGGLSRIDAVVLGADENLGEATCASAHQPSIWKDRAGVLWFATRQGLVAVDPRRDVVPATPLVVKIDALRADGKSQPAAGPLRVPALTRTVELDYSVLCLSTPERVRARVRLLGYDDDWTTPDVRGLARYARLAPGEYSFMVEAHLAGVPGTSARTSVPIVVLAAWWQTLWFRTGTVAAVLLLGTIAVRIWSLRRLRARLTALEHASALEQERARIAQNIHDDLGSGLTRISLLTQTGAPAGDRAQLDKIYGAVSHLTQSMDEIVWAVNPKNDNLESLANYIAEYAQGFLSDAGSRCRVQLPGFFAPHTLTAQARHHLFMACKEALHNVVKHAQATEVSVQISVDEGQLRIVIADNGRGCRAAQAAQAGLRTGNGLANMRARLAGQGGSCEISDSAGTKVTFSIPLTIPDHSS